MQETHFHLTNKYRCHRQLKRRLYLDHSLRNIGYNVEDNAAGEEMTFVSHPYPNGPTALMSLGVFMVLLWTWSCLVPPSQSTAAPGKPVTASEAQLHLKEELNQYVREQDLLRPDLQQKVFVRSNKTCRYHWQTSCPVLSAISRHKKNSLFLRTMTRQQAEAKKNLACFYCSEFENKQPVEDANFTK